MIMLPLLIAAALALGADMPFRDDFDGVLKEGWRWVDPKGDCEQSLQARPGFFRIVVRGYHDIWPGRKDFNAPRLVRDVEGDFVLETLVTSTERWSGGLLIWQDEKNYVRLDRGVHLRNQVILAASSGGKHVSVGEEWVDREMVRLRLKRIGNNVTASYSLDGADWKELRRMRGGVLEDIPRVEDGASQLKEKDYSWVEGKSIVDFPAAQKLQVGIDALGPSIAGIQIGKIVTDYDYVSIRRP